LLLFFTLQLYTHDLSVKKNHSVLKSPYEIHLLYGLSQTAHIHKYIDYYFDRNWIFCEFFMTSIRIFFSKVSFQNASVCRNVIALLGRLVTRMENYCKTFLSERLNGKIVNHSCSYYHWGAFSITK
jgi:hypothetical protein